MCSFYCCFCLSDLGFAFVCFFLKKIEVGWVEGWGESGRSWGKRKAWSEYNIWKNVLFLLINKSKIKYILKREGTQITKYQAAIINPITEKHFFENYVWGQRDGSLCAGTGYQVRRTELDPQELPGGRREPTPSSWPLTFTCAVVCVCENTHAHAKRRKM